MSRAIQLVKRAGQVARWVRHFPDQLLHAQRRQEALARVREQGRIKTAVFICHGNINRSAYAAAAFAQALAKRGCGDVVVRSAGFIGPGRAASELAQRVASRRGVDLSAHESRLIDVEELRSCDLVVVMSTEQRAAIHRMARPAEPLVLLLGDVDPEPIRRRTVQDPYGHPEDVFVQVFDRIDRCVSQLVRTLPG